MAGFLHYPSRFLFALTAVVVFGIQASAQYSIDSYQFSQQVSSYSPIAGGTVLGDIDIDEEVFNGNIAGATGTVTSGGFPIGFDFALGGETFNRFAVATNGYIRLGNGSFPIGNSTSGVFSADVFNPSDTVNFLHILAPFHGDLEGQTGSELSFQTIGTAPNRELVVQWKNFIFWNTTGTENLNFQVRLQENGSKVVFSYGNMVKNSTNKTVAVGIRGKDYKIVQLRRANIDSSDTWATSKKTLRRTANLDIRTNFKPANGLEFTFFSPPAPDNDMAVTRILVPSSIDFGCQGSAAEPLKVMVRNYGNAPQSSLNYSFERNGSLVGSGTVALSPSLNSNESREIVLPQTINLSAPGMLDLKVWQTLAEDTGIYQTNDTAKVLRTLFAPAVTPFPQIQNLNRFLESGWKTYKGQIKPSRPAGTFTNSSIYFSQSTSVNLSSFGSDSIQEWLVSPAIAPRNGQILKFRAAISTFDSTSAPDEIDDDEIKVMISTDCGNVWTSLLAFNDASLQSGQISNVRKGFAVPINGVTTPYQIAFFVNGNGTQPPQSYNVHLDDVTVGLGNAYDLATSGLTVVNQGNTTCSQTTFPVKVWVKNEGDSAVVSSKVSIQVNNLAPVIQTFDFTPPLLPGDSTEVTFPSVTITPNSIIQLIATSRLELEDGFSTLNDATRVSFVYLGSANPLPLPVLVVFDNLPSGVPAGWLADQLQGTDFKVRVRGTGATRSLSANLYSANKSSFAIMPITQVLPQGNSFLTFDLRIKNDQTNLPFTFGANDSVLVRVSTNCGTSFQTVFRSSASNPVGLENYTQFQINLSAFQGQAISVRFDAVINRTDLAGAWVDLDNISVSTVTNTNDLTGLGDVAVFPNPARTELRIDFGGIYPVASYRLRSADGKLLQSASVRSGDKLNVSNLQRGLYILEFVSGESVVRRKIVLD